jgi:lipopolysaccharide transport system permease protein
MNFKQFIGVTWQKARLNLKSETSVNYLSYGWWFLEPLIHMSAYYVVFGLFLQRGGDGCVFFLLVGLVPWLWFSRTISQASVSLLSGKGLMNKLFIPKLFFPLVRIVQTTFKQILVLIIFLIFLILCGHAVTIHWLAILPIFLVQLLLMLPLAALAALVVVYVRDFKLLIPTLLQFMFFSSGIFFSVDDVPEQYRDFLLLNPMAGVIQASRDVLLSNQWPDWVYLSTVAAISMIALVAIISTYHNLEQAIAKAVQE